MIQTLLYCICFPLNQPEVLSSLCTLQLQFCRLVADKLVEVRMFHSSPHLFIAVLLKGVQVHLQCAGEQHRLLWQREDFVDLEDNRQLHTNPMRETLLFLGFGSFVVAFSHVQ